MFRTIPPSRRAARWATVAGLVLVVLAGSAGPVGAATTMAWPVQSLGDRGTDVRAIQYLLRDALAGNPSVVLPAVDGLFGAPTDAAVRAVQSAHGLPANGIVDRPTWAVLAHPLVPGDTGPAVTALQIELIAKRKAPISATGVYDAATASAVTAFQKHMRMTPLGWVSMTTWLRLTWHYQLPKFGATWGLCDYSVGNGPANWGTAEAITTLEVVGRSVQALGYGRVAVGDNSLEHGGDIAGHDTHEQGLDVDIRPLRLANDQCWIAGTTWRSSAYDRTATRAMIRKFRASAPGHIKVIYFNDPVLIREGLTRWLSGHDDHVHVRFCEASHRLAAYDC